MMEGGTGCYETSINVQNYTASCSTTLLPSISPHTSPTIVPNLHLVKSSQYFQLNEFTNMYPVNPPPHPHISLLSNQFSSHVPNQVHHIPCILPPSGGWWLLGKGKGSPCNRPWGPKRGSRGIALPVREPRHEEGIGWLAPRPGRFTAGKETRYPLYRTLGGPQGRLDGCRKSRPHRDAIHGPSSP
jgi:hypothetical protein